MKYFPILFHAILAGVTIGWAWGLHHTPGASMVDIGIVTGLAVALAITCFVRFIFSVL